MEANKGLRQRDSWCFLLLPVLELAFVPLQVATGMSFCTVVQFDLILSWVITWVITQVANHLQSWPNIRIGCNSSEAGYL